MSLDPEPLEQFQQRCRDYRPYLTREQLRMAFNRLRLELDRATWERLHFNGGYGTPLEYDPAYQNVNDQEHALYLACITLDQALEAMQEGGQP